MSPKKNYLLCLDDSGTRHPTRNPGRKPKHGYDWFSLGGILLAEEDEQEVRDKHFKFCQDWQIQAPLHSSEIRAKSSAFSFIGAMESSEQERFYEELYVLMRDIPVFGMGCVVDRPGYNARYLEKYDEQKRWLLCKSAFSIVVERAAKYVASQNGRMRAYVERSDKKTDRRMREYFDEMRGVGMPFNAQNSAKYEPAESNFLKETLFEFRAKQKSSPLMQLADLYVWPISMGGYNEDCRPFARLKGDRKLFDCLLSDDELSKQGIKYYCFD